MIERRTWGLCLGLVLGLGACRERPSEELVARAQFGILYGGQVQERRHIPLVLDAARQSHGIRIDFSRPLTREVPIEWELDMPSPVRKRAGHARVAQLGRATARPGQRRFEHAFHFEPGHVPGTWNIRVLVDRRLVIDRPFLVHDPDRPVRDEP